MLSRTIRYYIGRKGRVAKQNRDRSDKTGQEGQNRKERTRVSPFRFKKFFAYKRNKANLDPFHMCFTISL